MSVPEVADYLSRTRTLTFVRESRSNSWLRIKRLRTARRPRLSCRSPSSRAPIGNEADGKRRRYLRHLAATDAALPLVVLEAARHRATARVRTVEWTRPLNMACLVVSPLLFVWGSQACGLASARSGFMLERGVRTRRRNAARRRRIAHGRKGRAFAPPGLELSSSWILEVPISHWIEEGMEMHNLDHGVIWSCAIALRTTSSRAFVDPVVSRPVQW